MTCNVASNGQRAEIMGETYPKHVACKSNEMPCVICGKPVNMDRNPSMIHVCNGGAWAMLDAEDHGELGLAGCLGFYPIGKDCLRNHPQLKPFAKKGSITLD